MKMKKMIVLAILLITADQVIKLVIRSYFFDTNFVIIPSILNFFPKFNSNQSWINDLLIKNFDIDLGSLFHLVLFLSYELIILLIYDFLRLHIPDNTKILDLAIVLQISEMICALSGNLIWEKGVLDYLFLQPFFVFDLKDVYGVCFICLFLLTLARNRKQLSVLSLKDLVSHINSRFRLKI